MRLKGRLHLASASNESQRCDDASDTALTENNGVAPQWLQPDSGATLFASIVFSETNMAGIIAALVLTLGVNGL